MSTKYEISVNKFHYSEGNGIAGAIFLGEWAECVGGNIHTGLGAMQSEGCHSSHWT